MWPKAVTLPYISVAAPGPPGIDLLNLSRVLSPYLTRLSTLHLPWLKCAGTERSLVRLRGLAELNFPSLQLLQSHPDENKLSLSQNEGGLVSS